MKAAGVLSFLTLLFLCIGGIVGPTSGSYWNSSSDQTAASLNSDQTAASLNIACILEFAPIPAGQFLMGSPLEEGGHENGEVQHAVELSAFAMMTTQVTQAQWEAVMGTNPSRFKGADRPVEQVSWGDVQVFIQKLNEQDPGKGYRLPTEAEWEYACRAGSTGKWCFGDDEARLGDYAWIDANAMGTTHPVGQKKANAWGLHDMHGNVREWCQDWYGDYPGGSVTNPTGASSGSSRVYRGGGWNYAAGGCRSAIRSSYDPSYRHFNLGFRIARNLP